MTATSLLATVTFTDAQAGVARPVGQSFLADTSLAYYQQLLAESVVIVGSSSPSSSPLFAGLSARDDVLLAADADADGVGDLIFQTAGVERARIKSNGVGSGWAALNGGSMPPKGNRCWAIGDSITANDSSHPGGELPLYFGTRSYLMWANLASDSRIYAEDFAATGGFTTAQVLATHVPTVVAARPHACVVLAGTNDVATTTAVPAATIANLTAIYTQLLAAGIIPIAATIPPKSGYTVGVSSLNAWVTRYARRNGIPLIDFYSLLADPATSSYLSAYDNGDGVHPNEAGAKLMGQTLATKMQSLFPPSPPWLSGSNLDALGLANPLLTTDTNSDGVPDGWTASGTGVTAALATDAGNVVGNAWTVTRGSTDTIMQGTTVTGVAGDRFACSMRVYLDTIPAAGSIYVATIDAGGNAYNSQPLRAWDTADANWRTLAWETVVPATRTGIRFRVLLNGTSGTKVRIAQPTLINLTANGLA